MKEERMMILAMLEEGKITSEEAIKLIDALEEGIIFKELENDEKIKDSKNDGHKNNKKEKDFKFKFNSLEDIGSDIGNALSNMFNGLRDFNPSFGFKSNYETITTDLDMDISEMENPSLSFRAINDSITLRPTNKDKLSIKVICQYKHGLLSENEPYFDFIKEGNSIIFNPKYNSNISIKLNVSLPKKHYDEIILKSTNGKIDIEELYANSLNSLTSNSSIDLLESNIMKIDLTSKNGRIEIRDTNSNSIEAHTTNSNIFLMNTTAQDINARTANGKVQANDIHGENIMCKTSNAPIEVKNISFHNIQLISSNGKIISSEMNLDKAKEIKLMTSNASITSDLQNVNKNIIFDLETSMGSIGLGMPDLIYTTNKQVNLGLKKIIAHSANYNISEDHLKFIASTANGSIKIN